MTSQLEIVARQCLKGAEDGSMTFPEIVGALAAAGFEGYAVDFRRGRTIYYPVVGAPVELEAHSPAAEIAPELDPDAMLAAIREAQALVPGYTYAGFCEKAAAAGCAGYMVSFSGRRALYYGRTAETHVEHFPGD